MAKNLSAIFKLQGTIEDLTFVNSKRYGLHARTRKNSKTAFVMTPALAESKDRSQLCNQYAQPVYHALRPEAHDGGAWSRLLKLLRAELKSGRPLGLECLKGFECNLQHPLAEVLAGGYDFSATAAQNQLRLHVLLHQHPKVADSMPRTGYQLRVVAIFRDVEKGTVHKEVVLGPLTQYNAALEPVELTVPLPAAEAPCMLLMGIVPHLQGGGAARIMSDSGMKVVWAADRSAAEVAEPETRVEIKADVSVAGAGVAAGNAPNNAYLKPGRPNGNENVTITQSTFLYNVTENKILFAGSAYGDADELCFGPGKTGNSSQPPGYKTWCCSYPASCVNHTEGEFDRT
ncbi:hypothetical protein HB364_15355 [Pseudoflavitalea sp. X16]|uniref:hypothetical protein n=1 Tax=Paraflavitalea devenefica TaxID=2716334 RepID=UPI0014202FD0|nr:hypothetical protein [Paraflavitalea devenefica]NII26465.1 hypothetical protein [Paraflavitalea devenefica]